jgi:hypothetical protein
MCDAGYTAVRESMVRLRGVLHHQQPIFKGEAK